MTLALTTAATRSDPGWPAFLAFVFLVVALWLLMRNMNARLRRMSYSNRAPRPPADATPEPDRAQGSPEDDGPRSS